MCAIPQGSSRLSQQVIVALPQIGNGRESCSRQPKFTYESIIIQDANVTQVTFHGIDRTCHAERVNQYWSCNCATYSVESTESHYCEHIQLLESTVWRAVVERSLSSKSNLVLGDLLD